MSWGPISRASAFLRSKHRKPIGDLPLPLLLGLQEMSDLSPQSGSKRTFDQACSHLAIYECSAYIPDMSREDSKRARHRQRQAAYEAASASGCPFRLVLSARAAREPMARSPPCRNASVDFEIALIGAGHRRHGVICSTGLK